VCGAGDNRLQPSGRLITIRGADVVDALNVKDEIHGIGGQIGLASVPWNASLVFRYLKEFGVKLVMNDELFVLTLAKMF